MFNLFKKKIGTEVVFASPIRKTYQVDTDNKALAVGIALDTIKRRYPTVDLSNVKYTTREYEYLG